MSIEQQLKQIMQLIDELETEMWYNIHADAPHQAHKLKTWVDQLKDQAATLKMKVEVKNISNQTTNQ